MISFQFLYLPPAKSLCGCGPNDRRDDTPAAMDVASVVCFAGCERSPFFRGALSVSKLSPTAEVISWRPTQFPTKKSQQQQIYETKGDVSWPSNTQIKQNKCSSSVNCAHFFPHHPDFLLFIDARLPRRYAAPCKLSCFACRHLQGISSTNVRVRVYARTRVCVLRWTCLSAIPNIPSVCA